jgi:DNA-binding NtrC family response regulator
VTHAPLAARFDVADIRRLRPDVRSNPKSSHREAHIEGEDAIYSEAVRAFRKKLILDRLRQHGNSPVEAAASLKISRATFFRYWTAIRRFP